MLISLIVGLRFYEVAVVEACFYLNVNSDLIK
jgi:hypothetical protein